MQSPTNYNNVNPVGKRFVYIFITVFIVLIGVFGYFSTLFKFTGVTPKTGQIGLQTNVVLSFNKTISNRDEIMANLTTVPVVKMSVIVDKNTVIILPIDSFEAIKYTVKIPLITSNGRKITNFTATFSPSSSAPGSSTKTAQDLDDIPLKQYPGLIKANQEHSNYKFNYALDGDNVIFDLLLLEPNDSSLTDDQAIAVLKKDNDEARAFIASLGVPKTKYIIRYDDATQQSLIYGASGTPTN